MATHSRILACRIPQRTEEPGGLQSMGLQRAGHDWSDSMHAHTYARLSQNKPAVRLQLGSADSWIDLDLKAIRILSIITVLFVDLVFLPLSFFLLFLSGFLSIMETLLLMTPELYIFQHNCCYSKDKKKERKKCLGRDSLVQFWPGTQRWHVAGTYNIMWTVWNQHYLLKNSNFIIQSNNYS